MKDAQEKQSIEVLKQEELSSLTEKLLTALGHNLKDPSFKDTPRRFAKYMLDFSSMTKMEPEFTVFQSKSDGAVIIRNLEVRSMCAHHLAPFFGKCTIAYYPSEFMAGLSKFQRTIDYLAMVPTEQETLTQKIHDYLLKKLKPRGLYVHLDCQHTCMIVRGVQTSGTTTETVRTSGAMENFRSGLPQII